MSTGNSLVDALLILLSGAAGTELLRWLTGFRAAQRKEHSDEIQLEIDQAKVIYDQAELFRKELRQEMVDLKKEVMVLRRDVDVWKQAYFDVFHTAREVQQQYALVTAYLNAILSWLKQQNIEIPMPVPVIGDLPILPAAPFSKEN